MKKSFAAGLLAIAAVLLSGCMHVELKMAPDADFPPADAAVLFPKKTAPEVIKSSRPIGSCVISGNYSEHSLNAMLDKLRLVAAENGANAAVYSVQIVPDGTRVSLDSSVISEETNNPNLANTWGAINRDFDGGYSSVGDRNYGTQTTYLRMVRASLYRLDELPESAPAEAEKQPEHQETPQ